MSDSIIGNSWVHSSKTKTFSSNSLCKLALWTKQESRNTFTWTVNGVGVGLDVSNFVLLTHHLLTQKIFRDL